MESAAQPSEIQHHLAELVPATGGAVGGALAGVAIGGAPGAVVGAAAGAVVEHVVSEALAHRRRRAAQALEIAANEARLSAEELLERIRANERLHELAAAVIAAAAETVLQAKIRALGQALARGTLASDDAAIDQERFMVGTLAALEAPHLRVLHLMNQRYNNFWEDRGPRSWHKSWGWTTGILRASCPGLESVMRPLLATLESLDLVTDSSAISTEPGTGVANRWVITEYGRRLLDLLETRGSEEPDLAAQHVPEG